MSDEAASTPDSRIVFLHIPKTAGTAVHHAFLTAFAGRRRVFPHRWEHEFAGVEADRFDYFSGHIGFAAASRIGGRMITVLRDPADRVLSVYYFFRHLFETGAERNAKTVLAMQHSLPDFLRLTDNPYLILELRNRMTWQLAASCELPFRAAYINQGLREDALLAQAIANLKRLTIFGLDSRLDRFARLARDRLGVDLAIGAENVTPNRIAMRDIDPQVLQLVDPWIELDRQLYDAARAMILAEP